MSRQLTRVLPGLGVYFNQRLPHQLQGELVEAVLQLGTVAAQLRPFGLLNGLPAPVLIPPHQALQQVHLEEEGVGRCACDGKEKNILTYTNTRVTTYAQSLLPPAIGTLTRNEAAQVQVE